MPGGRHEGPGHVPGTPASRSRKLASKIAWYSVVSGGSCPRPGGLLGSNRGSSEVPAAPALIHWPRRFGYIASSNACALTLAIHSAAASAAAARVLSWYIPFLPYADPVAVNCPMAQPGPALSSLPLP